jgi:pimeloyl-ACP methyl ester carboxylesterase
MESRLVKWMRRLCGAAILAAIPGLPLTAAEADSCYLDGWAEPLRCYRVPLGTPGGAQTLAVMVAPALNGTGREPLYLLAGGPGQAASDLAPLLNAFRKINRERAMVLVDRRGAGRSGAFRCGFGAQLPADLDVFAQALAGCYLGQRDYAEQLNSRQAVEDLERVRLFLGHQRIALWGGSWGTRTALLYQQWYPDSLSALVLDAVAPIDTKVFLTAAAAERALQALERDCSADSVCAQFGDWRGELDRLLAGWDNRQAQHFPDPLTGAPTAEPVQAWMLANAVRAALYDPAAAAQLPYAISQAGRGNYLPLSSILGLFAGQADSMAMGLTFSVACAEEMNRISAQEIVADSAATFLGQAFIRPFLAGCQVWPVAPKPYAPPQARNQPVLLISGAADPITPPEYAKTQLNYLSNKQHLIVAGGGHINSRRGCIPNLIARFLDAPLIPLDDTCVATIHRPPFMADASGPALSAGSAVP